VERPRLERRLRRVVHLVLALCAVVVVVAKLPGRHVYADANNCFGSALASLGTTEHHHDECTPSYTRLLRTEEAGGWAAIVFAVAVALGAGIVHRKPTRAKAVAWIVWTALAGVGAAVMSFELNFFDHVVTLWPTHVLAFALGMLLVFVLIAVPIIAIATRERVSDSSAIARSRSRNP
jgi:hypothetical protein